MNWRWLIIIILVGWIIARYGGQSSGPSVGDDAPAISVETLSGEDFNLADTRGQVVVLDFWATWCPPCKRSLPALQQVYEAHLEDEDVLIVSVNTDIASNRSAGLTRFMESKNLSFPVLLDAPRNAISGRYKIQSIPTLVVVAPSGKVHEVVVGLPAATTAGIAAHIESLIEDARD